MSLFFFYLNPSAGVKMIVENQQLKKGGEEVMGGKREESTMSLQEVSTSSCKLQERPGE